MAGIPSSLPCCTRHCLRQRPSSLATIRFFTTSLARRKPGLSLDYTYFNEPTSLIDLGELPTFPPTSDPALDALLNTFRQNVFLPSLLLRPQQALIYKTTRNHHLLGEDPVAVTVPISGSTKDADTETVTLTPLNRFKDEPNSKEAFHKVLELMKEKKDWDVLPGFLEGLSYSGRVLTQNMQEKLVRRAALAGRTGLVIEILRRSAKTGVRIDNYDVARWAMRGALETAIRSDWSEDGLKKAAHQAIVLLELMDDPRNGVRKDIKDVNDPRKRPEILGLAMGLLAAGGGEVQEVKKLAQRMLETPKSASLQSPILTIRSANSKLVRWAPVRWAMEKALGVLGVLGEGDLGRRIKRVMTEDIQPTIDRALEIMKEQVANEREDGKPDVGRIGLITYEQLEQSTKRE